MWQLKVPWKSTKKLFLLGFDLLFCWSWKFYPVTPPNPKLRGLKSPHFGGLKLNFWFVSLSSSRDSTHPQDYFTIKVCSVGKSDRRRDVTQGNPLRPSEWGFKIGHFPNIYGDFCTFSCFSRDTEDQIFQWSNSYRCAMYTYGARPM